MTHHHLDGSRVMEKVKDDDDDDDDDEDDDDDDDDGDDDDDDDKGHEGSNELPCLPFLPSVLILLHVVRRSGTSPPWIRCCAACHHDHPDPMPCS